MPEVLLIADDLTGALDSAVAFAARGMAVTVARDVGHLPAALATGAEVVAVATGTRDGSEAAARACLAEVRQVLDGVPGLRFKKVDSRLKGHVAAEIDALLGPDHPAIFACPAIPWEGRFLAEGCVHGRGVATPLPVAQIIGRAVEVPEITEDSPLSACLPETFGTETLLVGAAGMARALAERLRPDVAPCPAPALPVPLVLAVGSRDPITLAQLTELDPQLLCPAPGGIVPAQEVKDVQVVHLTDGADPMDPREIGGVFASAIAAQIRAQPPAALFGCGGETANAILGALGVGLLRLLGELQPGIPAAVCLDGLPGLCVATKSGGFGAPDALVRLVAASQPVAV